MRELSFFCNLLDDN